MGAPNSRSRRRRRNSRRPSRQNLTTLGSKISLHHRAPQTPTVELCFFGWRIAGMSRPCSRSLRYAHSARRNRRRHIRRLAWSLVLKLYCTKTEPGADRRRQSVPSVTDRFGRLSAEIFSRRPLSRPRSDPLGLRRFLGRARCVSPSRPGRPSKCRRWTRSERSAQNSS